MRKIFYYGWQILKFSYQANGSLAVISIVGKIYQNTLFPFLQVFFVAQIINQITANPELEFSQTIPYVIGFIISAITNYFFKTYASLQGFLHDTQFGLHLSNMINTKLASLDPATFEKSSFQELLAQVEGVRGLMNAQLDRFVGFINAIVKVVTASIIILPLFPFFVPLIFCSVIPAYYVGDVARKKLWPFFTTRSSKVHRIIEYIKSLLSQDSTSKETAIYRTGEVLRAKVLDTQQKYIREYREVNDPFIVKEFSANLFQLSIFLYTQYFNLVALLNRSLGVGQFALAFQQTLQLASGAQEVLDMYSSMLSRIQQVEKFFDFLQYPATITSPEHSVALPKSPNPPTIQFINVSFRYPGTKRNILDNFNLIIHTGEKIALVGENGAGKTTIIKLLLRFYDVTSGEILVNGVNIKDLDLEVWHQQIGALFQDFIKYQFTFKENVLFGNLKGKSSKEMINDAISKSGASNYVTNLPKKLNQVVGKMFEDGIDLSGGQWQKLALARAFYRNAPILILDEPTSAIDAKAEYEIFENVQKLQQDKTVFIISHRFSTVRNADRILVLDGGRIIEEGTHETLMQQQGHYAELFNIQAKGYK